jgi:alpha-glucosidase (family GH31 glycosyl hydrolase)
MKENDDPDNNNDAEDLGDFRKVPIEHSIEIINIINNINKISRDKFKKKFFKTSLIVIVIFIFLIITKRMIYDGIIKILYEDKDDNYEFNVNNTYEEDSYSEIYPLFQNKSKIDMKSFASPQLRKPKNIKLIENLDISVDIEFEKFVHLKIKDADKKRWEIPEKDVLNSDYLKNRSENIETLSSFTKALYSEGFYIELLTREDEREEEDDIDYDDMHDFGHFKEFDKNASNEEFAFRILTNENEEFYYFNSSENFIFSDTFISFQSKLTSDEIYGFGERTHDFKLDEGIYTMWPYDCGGTKYDDGKGGMNQYSHQPIGLHKTIFKNLWIGFVFLNTNAQDVVINHNINNDTEVFLTHKTIGGIIDYYIIVGNEPEEVVRNIQFLLGIPPLPPYWSLGNHQSKYGIKSFNEFKEIYENYKKYKIPIDTMWIDIDSMDNYEIFTLNKAFEKIKPYIKNEIHKDGGKFVPIIDMGLTYEKKDSPYVKLGDSLDIFIKSNYTKKPLIAKVWPGKTVFPDFFNPKIDKFWNKGLKDYHTIVNYDGIWLDMNEPANLLKNTKCIGEIADEKLCTKNKNKYYYDDLPYLPGYRKNVKESLSYRSINENAIVYGNNTIYDVKPLLSFYQTKLTYEFLQNDLKYRPFILSRSTTLGSGKYAFHWLGDNYSSYGNLKNSISGIFNFNLFGIPFSGSDICGFNNDANKELCIRWYNLGSFYPFMRNHNSKRAKDQFPWSFTDKSDNIKYDMIKIVRNNINYRYSLLRYMYSQFFLISLNEKVGFFMPIMFEFPEEKIAYEDIEKRIMFGESFLICAFYDKGEEDQTFELPNSHFNRYPSGKTITNYEKDKNMSNSVKLSGKLDKLHIFLRGGYIVPYQDTFEKYILNSMKLREEKLNIIINIDNKKESKGSIFFDNDGINTIKNKEFIRVDLFYNNKQLDIFTNRNNLEKYNYNDNILGNIEMWRADEVFGENIVKKKDMKFKMNIIYQSKINKKEENIEGYYDKIYNKVIFNIFTKDRKVNLFDIDKIMFN